MLERERSGAPVRLPWLFPLTYALHIAEEFWGREGFHRWIARVSGRTASPLVFWVLNVTCLALMVLAIAANARRPRAWVLPALATVVIVNGAGHALGTAITGIYSPGLVTGTVLWIPLGVGTLVVERRRVGARALGVGIVAGLLVHAAVVAVAAGTLPGR
ncbi:MAG TPA: HXXEE domain-containing protein [Anaeromyxobacteraceae bacterium]|nr:HXXEE domain-containing protein [Anaeromyxobacteraceae bacterium]